MMLPKRSATRWQNPRLYPLFSGGYTGFYGHDITAYQTATGTTIAQAATDPAGRLVNSAVAETWTAFYTADFSAGVDGWTASNGTADGNIDSIQSLDNWLRLTVGASSAASYLTAGTGRVWGNVNRRVTLQVYVPSGQAQVNGFRIYSGNTSQVLIYDGANMNGSVVSIDATYLGTVDDLRVYAMNGTSTTITGGSGQLLYIRAVVTYSSNLPQFFNATTAERPTLASIPFGGRKNLATANTESSSGWILTSETPTDNYSAAPDGNTTSLLLVQSSGTATPARSLTLAAGRTYNISLYWKPSEGTANWIRCRVTTAAGSASQYFSLSSLTVGNGGSFANQTITDIGTGWYRISFDYTPSAGDEGSRQVAFIPVIGNGSGTTDTGKTQVVWGFQYSVDSGVKPYQKVTSNFLVTQSGKPQVQSLYFDGVDFLSSGLAEWPGNLDFFCEAGKAFTINVCGNLLVRATAALFARYAAASGSRTLGITINSSTGFIGTELRGTTASSLSGDWTDGTIRQFTLRWDGTTATVWADADASQTVGVGTAAEETSVSITFGSRFSGLSPVTGYLFPPFAINRALTNAEVAQLHALNRARYGSR